MFAKTDSPDFSDSAIRRFLLGRLTAAEQFEFEQQLFTNARLESRVRQAEIVLADDYARGRLSRADQDQAHGRFLVTEDRQRLHSVSQALHDRFAPVRIRAVSSGLDFRAPVWRYAFAAILLTLIFATVWRVTKQPRIQQLLSGPIPFKPKPGPTQSPVITHHRTTDSVPEHREPVVPLSPHEAALVAVWLDGKASNSNPAVVKIPDPNTAIHLQVLLAGAAGGAYRADIFTIAYQPVFSVDWLESKDGSKLEFTIPAGVLKPGEYKVKFMRLGKDATEVVYYFRLE